jgi:hypothetical protein
MRKHTGVCVNIPEYALTYRSMRKHTGVCIHIFEYKHIFMHTGVCIHIFEYKHIFMHTGVCIHNPRGAVGKSSYQNQAKEQNRNKT